MHVLRIPATIVIPYCWGQFTEETRPKRVTSHCKPILRWCVQNFNYLLNHLHFTPSLYFIFTVTSCRLCYYMIGIHRFSDVYLKYNYIIFLTTNTWGIRNSKKNIKWPYAHHILIPLGSTGSSNFFWYQIKAHIFLFANPKFQLQILRSFGDITKNGKLNGIPENYFLCIFIIASSPGVHIFFFLWRVNKKLP